MQEKAMCSHVHLPFGRAFFPGDANAWEKPQRALKAQIDLEEGTFGVIEAGRRAGSHSKPFPRPCKGERWIE